MRGPTRRKQAVLTNWAKSLKCFEAKHLQFRMISDGVLILLQQIVKMKKTDINSSVKELCFTQWLKDSIRKL
jgi:hypothetical protein